MKFLRRKVLVLLILSLPLLTFAQTDSTEIQLQKYKDLYEKGLINEKEYEDLKRDALKIPVPVPAQGTVVIYPKQDTIDMRKLKGTFKAQLVTGSLCMGATAALIASGIHFRNKPFYRVRTDGSGNQVKYQVGYHTREARICFVMAAVFGGVGIYHLVKGSKNRKKYFRLSASPNNLSLLITF